MSKYTPATALAIKRDVQDAQSKLEVILKSIEDKRDELANIEIILNEKRGLLSRFEDMAAGVFSRDELKVQQHTKRIDGLNQTISRLEAARDLLIAEVSSQHDDIQEPEGAVLVQSLIQELEPVLERLVNQINISEKNLRSLEEQRAKFKEANSKLLSEVMEQEKKVESLRFAAKEVTESREKILRELTRESQTLNLVRQRAKNSNAMNIRLSEEYQAVYNRMPRRGKRQ